MSLRTPQIRIEEGTRCKNIVYGDAKILSVTMDGIEGWALPGGKFTRNRKEAEYACREASAIIKFNGGIKTATLKKAS